VHQDEVAAAKGVPLEAEHHDGRCFDGEGRTFVVSCMGGDLLVGYVRAPMPAAGSTVGRPTTTSS
jgi:hypothetical protein